MSFSINHLGNNGHLGNQMFQYAFVKSMSVKHSRSFCIPPNNVFGKYYYQKLFSNIDECFDIKCNRLMTEFPYVVERFFHFDEDLFENPPEYDVNYVGFFQSEKYFKHINVGTGEDVTIKQLAETIASVVRYSGEIEWDTTKPNGTPRKVLNVDKIKELGWEPKINLREGIELSYNWYKENACK